MNEALQDYAHCFRPQEGLDDRTAEIEAMRAATQTLFTAVYGGVKEFRGVYHWRIRGEGGATGPRRLTREEAAKDGAEVTRAISGASGLEEKQALVRSALKMVVDKQSAADRAKVNHAQNHFARQSDGSCYHRQQRSMRYLWSLA